MPEGTCNSYVLPGASALAFSLLFGHIYKSWWSPVGEGAQQQEYQHTNYTEEKARAWGCLRNGWSICHCRSTLTTLPEVHLLATKGQSSKPQTQRAAKRAPAALRSDEPSPQSPLQNCTLRAKPLLLQQLKTVFAGKKFYSGRTTAPSYTKPTAEFIQNQMQP